jgi:hypothetical protein
MAEETPRPLSAAEMFLALVQAGLFREEDGPRTRHVSIDLDAENDVVIVRSERYADTRLLDAVPLLARALTVEQQVTRTVARTR